MNPNNAALEKLRAQLDDPIWRVTSGKLYKIITKGSADSKESLIVNFIPNEAQMILLDCLHDRNLILKARQLGFSTLICILWLDTALFSKDPIACGIIAQDKEAAEGLFNKVTFAYKNMPKELRDMFPLSTENKGEIVFAHNGSRVKVGTSMRSGTYPRLHVSEFGKICARYPQKAAEVMTGSIPAVPASGILIIESTAEGQEGEFYDLTQRAKALFDQKRELTSRDYAFHFFPWWKAADYTMNPDGVIMTRKDEEYFTALESKVGQEITAGQRAWYVATRDADFPNHHERMWQEYPSTPEEAFQRSTDGCYYVNEMAAARKQGRITAVPWEKSIPVNTFWDIGLNDEMAIWFHQRVGMQDRFIRYYENSSESFDHYVAEMHKHGYVWGRHYLPHDGDTKRLGMESNWTPKQMLEKLGLRNIEIVPRIDRVQTGIQMTRNAFSTSWFDETDAKDGIKYLDMYRKEWDSQRAVWKDEPRHDKASNGADAFRQFGQMRAEMISPMSKSIPTRNKTRNWRTV